MQTGAEEAVRSMTSDAIAAVEVFHWSGVKMRAETWTDAIERVHGQQLRELSSGMSWLETDGADGTYLIECVMDTRAYLTMSRFVEEASQIKRHTVTSNWRLSSCTIKTDA